MGVVFYTPPRRARDSEPEGRAIFEARRATGAAGAEPVPCAGVLKDASSLGGHCEARGVATRLSTSIHFQSNILIGWRKAKPSDLILWFEMRLLPV